MKEKTFFSHLRELGLYKASGKYKNDTFKSYKKMKIPNCQGFYFIKTHSTR